MNNYSLLIVLLFITVIWFYFGFLRQSTEKYLLPRLRGGFFIFAFLSALMGYVVYKEITSSDSLAAYVTLYNGNLEAVYIPDIVNSETKVWLFESTDSIQDIVAFYSDKKNTIGWNASIHGQFVMLTRENLELQIMISKNQKTLVSYELKKL